MFLLWASYEAAHTLLWPPPADLQLYKTTAEQDVFKNESNGAIYCPHNRDT